MISSTTKTFSKHYFLVDFPRERLVNIFFIDKSFEQFSFLAPSVNFDIQMKGIIINFLTFVKATKRDSVNFAGFVSEM